MLDSNGDSGPPGGVPSVTAIFVPLGITTPAVSHPSHQGQQPPIGDPLGNPVEQALMMDPVENFVRDAEPAPRTNKMG